jgi:hypothetical protein
MSTRELDYLYAPTPHNMLTDRKVSAEAARVWGIIHLLKWNRIDPKPETIAEIMDVNVRSVRRWLGELAEQQWLIWNHNCADPWKRFVLRADAGSVEAAILTQVRALFADGTPTIEEIRAIIDPDDSDSAVLSDSGVPKDSNDPKDSGVPKDTGVQTSDSTITDSDAGVQTSDSTITRIDRGVRNGEILARPDASNGHRRESHGGGGSHDSLERDPPTTTPAPRRKIRPAEITTATGRWMVQKGFGLDRAYKCQHLPLADCQADFERRWELGQRHGAIGDAWLVAPPPHPAPAADPQRIPLLSSADSARRARAIAADATMEEIAMLAVEMEEGATDDQALDWLARHRAFQAQWAAKEAV